MSNLSPDEALVQVDFAENYSCRYQDEVQAAHWDQQQVTVFPIVIWTSTSCESNAIISDERNHDKQPVAVFMNKVLTDFVKQNHPEVKTVHIFSDGRSSQFKNKYIVQLLYGLQESSGLCLKWHYFVTSHGKGVVDGVGGTVKRLVWSAVATRKAPLVDDAKSFAEVAEACSLSTKVSLVPKEEIKESKTSFGLENASTIPGIFKIHCVEPSKGGRIILRKFSSQAKAYMVHDICNPIKSDNDDDDDDDDDGNDDDDGEDSDRNDGGDDDDGSVFCQSKISDSSDESVLEMAGRYRYVQSR